MYLKVELHELVIVFVSLMMSYQSLGGDALKLPIKEQRNILRHHLAVTDPETLTGCIYRL